MGSSLFLTILSLDQTRTDLGSSLNSLKQNSEISKQIFIDSEMNDTSN